MTPLSCPSLSPFQILRMNISWPSLEYCERFVMHWLSNYLVFLLSSASQHHHYRHGHLNNNNNNNNNSTQNNSHLIYLFQMICPPFRAVHLLVLPQNKKTQNWTQLACIISRSLSTFISTIFNHYVFMRLLFFSLFVYHTQTAIGFQRWHCLLSLKKFPCWIIIPFGIFSSSNSFFIVLFF